jgi:uncharacterized repeat protein (TIGR03803 family)
MIDRRIIGTTLLAAILVAGCSGSQPVQPVVGSERLATTAGSSPYRIVYNFGTTKSGDGFWPAASLIDVNGTLYGVTGAGGQNGTGTIFSINLAGTEQVLHSFSAAGDPTDGQVPFPGSGLRDVRGTLYGTTWQGGKYGGGIAYRMSPAGTEKVLYNFNPGHADTGAHAPTGTLIDVNGTLYGTTGSGGKYEDATGQHGTVFSISPATGTARIVHSFGHGNDGRNPESSLIDVNGTLYGLTSEGGSAGELYAGDGTVFSVSPSGTERVLHSFGHGNDGSDPMDIPGLLDVNGTLYGTTVSGGKYNLGTVFSISLTGTERVLHVFGGSGDGTEPKAGLIDVNGTLYGTTSAGGAYDEGTIFSISATGTERVLHSFGHGSDGQEPQSALLDVNGTLYGTTTWGGRHGDPGLPKHGTIFALTLAQ